jgi:hypothetical protein
MHGMMEAQGPARSPGVEQVKNVILHFCCGFCCEAVTVTLRCEGPNLEGEAARQTVSLPLACPTCGQDNELVFELCGRVRSVRRRTGAPAIPVPSLN